MKPIPQLLKVFLVAIVCSWLLFFPAYVHYYNLTQSDSFRNAHVENPVLSDHLASLEKKWSGLTCLDHFLMASETVSLLSLITSQIISSMNKFSPLRC